jgi:hypothetical protein
VPWLVAGIAAAGCVVTALALVVRRALLVPWGIALVGAAYALFLRLRGGAVDANAVYVAAALVAAAELAFMSLRPAVPAADWRARWDGLVRVVVVALATLVAGEVILAASGSATGGLVMEGFGVAAAVVAVAVVVVTAARTRA